MTLKVQFLHFLTNHNSSQGCFKTITFEYIDSWAKILHFRTHHLKNSTTELTLVLKGLSIDSHTSYLPEVIHIHLLFTWCGITIHNNTIYCSFFRNGDKICFYVWVLFKPFTLFCLASIVLSALMSTHNVLQIQAGEKKIHH